MTPRSSAQFSAQDPTEFASIPRSPSSLTLSLFQPAFAMPGRIFTDIFCGFDSPLASAILANGGQVFRVDILLDKFMDIFNDDFYEQLLRFSACGKSAYIACSPCCGEYSRLKLKPGPGPKPLRSPDHLGGLPDLTMQETIRLQDSFLQLSRGVQFWFPWPFGATSKCDVMAGRSSPSLFDPSMQSLREPPSLSISFGYS